MGAIIGIMLTGLVADRLLRSKKFVLILILNIMLYVFDIYLFATVNHECLTNNAGINTFSAFLGGVLCSNDLVYLILMPMLIAKNHSEKMAQLSQYQRVCFAGTIVGVTLALCEVGKYLFSDNLAAFLNYLTKCNTTDIYSCVASCSGL